MDIFDKNSWSNMLKNSGYTQADMLGWHRDFENSSPSDHKDFLLALGMSEDEINNLRSIIDLGK